MFVQSYRSRFSKMRGRLRNWPAVAKCTFASQQPLISVTLTIRTSVNYSEAEVGHFSFALEKYNFLLQAKHSLRAGFWTRHFRTHLKHWKAGVCSSNHAYKENSKISRKSWSFHDVKKCKFYSFFAGQPLPWKERKSATAAAGFSVTDVSSIWDWLSYLLFFVTAPAIWFPFPLPPHAPFTAAAVATSSGWLALLARQLTTRPAKIQFPP